MYGVNVKMTGVRGGEPVGVFGKYRVAFSSPARVAIPSGMMTEAAASFDHRMKMPDRPRRKSPPSRCPAIERKQCSRNKNVLSCRRRRLLLHRPDAHHLLLGSGSF